MNFGIKIVYTVSATFTQNEALVLFEKETGSKWKVSHKSTKEAEKEGYDALEKGDIMTRIMEIILSRMYSDKELCVWDDEDMRKLGIAPDVGLEAVIKDVSKMCGTK